MVESTPFDEEDWDEPDPYDTALNSDEDTEQLRTVSQEDDLADSNEDAPNKNIVTFSDGSKKSPATSGVDPTTLALGRVVKVSCNLGSVKISCNLGSNPVGHLWLEGLKRGAGLVRILWLECHPRESDQADHCCIGHVAHNNPP
jgi:hypothetical protein